MIVVSDTTPINYLVQLDLISLLRELYETVYVPTTVLQELQHPATPSVVREWALKPPAWMVVLGAPQVVPALVAHLGAGERDALSLALEIRADKVLLDDGQGRSAARRLGLSVAGTLGVIRAAALTGRVDYDATTEQLTRLGFRASQETINEARP